MNLAETLAGYAGVQFVKDPLKTQKMMYAASAGEHIQATSAAIFAMLKSSTNILITPAGNFSASYLNQYLTKKEEHADGQISAGTDRKSLGLTTEGIVNSELAAVKFANQQKQKTQRQREHVCCKLLSLTEKCFCLLELPYVMTKVDFMRLSSASRNRVGLRRTAANGSRFIFNHLTSHNFHDNINDLRDLKKLNHSHKVMLFDQVSNGRKPRPDDSIQSEASRASFC